MGGAGEQTEASASAVDGEATPLRRSYVGLWLLLGLLGATAVFAWMSYVTFGEFLAYKARTLPKDGSPLWPEGATVEQCIDVAYGWGILCTGMPTLCDGHTKKLMHDCVAAEDRSDYCASVRNQIGTTGFGYHACERRLKKQLGPSGSRRKAENLCGALYRIAADNCS